MRLNKLKEGIGNLLLLNKNILRSFESRENVLNANIKYWLKNNELVLLKKGAYILKDKYDKEPQKDLYLEYISNQLIQPSYLSLEYVLAKYQLLTEPVRAITLITTKTTREITNKIGVFRYYSISQALFTDYEIKYFYDSPIMIAQKNKALFDYLYLRFLKNAPINGSAVKNLRINWENVSEKEFAKLYSYLALTESKRIKNVLDIIRDLYYD